MNNRIIKFRAWDTDNNCYSSLKLTDFVYQETTNLIVNGDFGGMGGRMVFQQWTGLKDKNGIEIFEGDKTKSGYVIMWSNRHALFCEHYHRSHGNEWSEASYPIDAERIEIIGNIYENNAENNT